MKLNSKATITLTVLVVFSSVCGSARGQDCGGQWSADFNVNGLDGEVYAAVVFNDGTGDALYVGGSFSLAGTRTVANIAKWDGTDWSDVGSGVNGDVLALAVFDDGNGAALYAGGTFTTAGGGSADRIAKWDGADWSGVGSGMNDSVRALGIFDDGGGAALYAGGAFTVAGGTSANRIAKWDGAGWSALGSGLNNLVASLAVYDDGGGPDLYAGGTFTTADGSNAFRIASWDGANWSAVESGIAVGTVNALTVFDDGSGPALYAGGNFAGAIGVESKNIVQWDGTAWSPLGTGMNLGVSALTVYDDGNGPKLYAGGSFTSAGGVAANRIARWTGGFWNALSTGMDQPVSALAVFDDGGGPALYAGGEFTSAGGEVSMFIAEWTPSAAEPGAPLTAPSIHQRRKNRYLSFDPNKACNDDFMVAFKVELKSINMGSCSDATGGNVDFCRMDRGLADCNSCLGGAGGTCITTPIHCSTGGGVCTPTGAACVNDLPHAGGSNVGQVWWVGPEHPSGNGVHLLVSEAFRKESMNWGTHFDPINHPGEFVVHVGDCEVVPQATYGVRAVEVDTAAETGELLIETTQFVPQTPPTPFWWGDAVGSLAFRCNGDPNLSSCFVPSQVADCGVGIPCLRTWLMPNGSVNFDDVNAVLTLVAPPHIGVPTEMTWVDLHGGAGDAPPNGVMNASDIQQAIFGFGGFPYAGFDPKDCPDATVWP